MDSVFAVVMVLIGVIVLMVIIGFLGSILPLKRSLPVSPYSEMPLRRAGTLRYTTQFIIKRYLKDMEDYDNRQFELNRASLCRETGRIFPDSVNWYGKMHVDWNFLRKRMPGSWISYGSLAEDRRQEIWDKHGTLAGFQTELSCEKPLPQEIEEEFNIQGQEKKKLITNLEEELRNTKLNISEIESINQEKNSKILELYSTIEEIKLQNTSKNKEKKIK